MPYCLECGVKLSEGEKECPNCKHTVETAESLDGAEEKISKPKTRKRSSLKVWIIVCAVILVITVSLVLVFTVNLPGNEPLIKTTSGNFTYTQNYTDKYSEYSPKANYVFLVFDLTPVKSNKIDKDDEAAYTFKNIQAIIDDNSYDHFSQRTTFSKDGLVSMISFVFVVDKTHELLGDEAELDLR